MEKLDILQSLNFEEAITRHEYHTYYPRTNSFNLNDEVRFSIRHQDIYTLPSESYIHLEGTFIEDVEGTGDCSLTNNAYAFLFEQIRYEINGVEIDRCNKPGITTTIKSLASYNDGESKMLQMAGWNPFQDAEHAQPTLSKTKFNACIPMKFLMGFFEDYNRILINVSQELILVRSRTNENCYKNSEEVTGTKKASIEVTRIEWHVPHVSVNDEIRFKLLDAVQNSKTISIPFRKWDLYELPSLRATTTDIWPIKSSNNLEKPRYVLVAFQKGKKDNYKADASMFDHCSITNMKLYLNSENYPYSDMNLDMSERRYARAYRMYTSFRPSYYGKPSEPLMSYSKFNKCSVFIIDCSAQNEAVKSSTVDIKLEMMSKVAFSADTVAYCLILHDCVFEYEPIQGTVKKII